MEAHQYDSARAIYETLLRNNPQTWEKAILHYNLGVIDIEEARWAQALQEFDEASRTQEVPIWLLERLQTNRAIALIGRIQEILSYVLPESSQPNEVIDQLQQLVTQAQDAITTTKTIGCQLADANACSTPRDLVEFHLVLKDMENEIERQFEAQRIANLPTIDLIGTLIGNLKSDRHQVSVLDENMISTFLSMRESQRAPYWSALKGHLDEPTMTPATATSRATAITAIDEVIEVLNHFFLGLFPQQPLFLQLIAQLRLDYAEALGAELSLGAFQTIQESYRRFGAEIPTNVLERLTQARTAHQHGMQALQQDRPAIARIFFAIAALWADLTMQAIPAQEPKSPSDWLSRMITLQESVNNSTRKVQTVMASSSAFAPTLQYVLRQIQKASLGFTEPFLASVLQQEQKNYAAGECQNSPWKQALPDFLEGHAEAIVASDALGQLQPHWVLVRESQQRAISLWRSAWNHLHHPEPLMNSPKIEKEEPLPKDTQTKQLPLSETIRFLQQMESEDRPERPSGSPENGVVRPW